ncbi:MAG TPA: ribonuclease J [Actinomycetota bacterium]|nr:ribonuclease J [Actinomycetota bacterium]
MQVSSPDARCRLVFLGGVGEVGRNMAAVELDGRLLIVDVGLSFPSADMPGIDLVLPDFEWLRGRADAIDAIVLTHGHEDHVGALPYLLRDLDRRMPVLGTAFTLELLKGKLDEHQVVDLVEGRVVEPGGGDVTVGAFTLRFLHVTHSIPDGAAIAIDTPHGTILHTGDFKIDQTPIDNDPTDLHGLAEEAGRGVHLLLSDSTNAEEPGHTTSERTVGPVIERIVRDAPEIVVVACFSSHIHRVQQVVDAALANRRVVAFLGRSMQNSVAAARRLGILKVDDRDVVDISEVDRLDPGNVVVICTGSQGEPFSALSLMAAREHKWVKLKEHDTVVLSSSLIPGNEPAIHRVVDALYRSGADVYHVPSDPVHASGHAAQEELRLMLSLVRPRWFIPVHGERRHLQHHARLAEEVGIPRDRILICEDGDLVEVGDQVRVVDRVPAGMTFVDGLGIGDVGGEVLRDRRKLAGDGVVVVVLTVDGRTGELVGNPEILNRGFVHEGTSGEIIETARERVKLALEESAGAEVIDPTMIQQNVRRVLKRYFLDVTQRKPVILPVVMEV